MTPSVIEPPDPAADHSVGNPVLRKPPQGAPLVGYLLAATGAVLFSTKSVIIKLAYAEGVNAETLLALRMGLSVPIYLAIGLLAMQKQGPGGMPNRRSVFRAAWVGVLGYWLASYTDFLGLQYISAHFERLILFTYPGFVVLFGAMFFGQRVRAAMLLALGVSYVGLAIIFLSHHTPTTGKATAIGATLVLTASMAYAGYQLLAKPVIEVMGPRLFTCIAMTAAAVVAIGQFLLMEPATGLMVSPAVLGYSLLLAIGATVVPSFMLNMALHRISAQANGVIGTLSPVATIVLAVVILGEALGWGDILGAGLVVAGVGWFTLAERREA